MVPRVVPGQVLKTYLAEAISCALRMPSSKSVWMTRILRLAGFIKQELEKKGNRLVGEFPLPEKWIKEFLEAWARPGPHRKSMQRDAQIGR